MRALVAALLCVSACTCGAPPGTPTPMPSPTPRESLPFRQPTTGNGSSAPAIASQNPLRRIPEAARVSPEHELAQHLASRCDADDASRCFLLAYLYREGVEVAASAAHARALTERACRSGHAPACEGALVVAPTELPELAPGVAGRVARLEACVAGLAEACAP